MLDLKPGIQPPTSDRAGPYLRVGVYIVLYILTVRISAPFIVWLGGYFAGVTLGQIVAAVAVNWLALRIFTRCRLTDIGLKWNRASLYNLALGLAGGMGAAALALAPPLAARIAWLAPAGPAITWDIFLFTLAAMLAGSAGEEILFRGFGFQTLLQVWGPFTTIFSVGALTVANSKFTGNKAGDQGGGIACTAGTCALTDVVFTHNKSGNDGGACAFEDESSATLLRVTMAGNFAADTGGGMDSDGGATVTIQDSTVSGNRSRHEGGGLDPSVGTVNVTNTTISGNKSAKGGGIQLESGGVLVLDHCTIAHNKAKEGGGLWTEPGTSALVSATIIATNTPFDCFGPILSNGSDLIGRQDGCIITGDTTTNIVGGPKPVKPVNPRLGPLKDNGGATKTHALLTGSPAIDAVVGTCAPAADQRGSPRVGACDIGAFEVQ